MRIVFSDDGRDFQRRGLAGAGRGRPGRHLLPHAGVPEAVLGGVRRDARAPAARVRRGGRRHAGGRRRVRADRRHAAVPRRHGGHRLHGPGGPARPAGGDGEGAVGGARSRATTGPTPTCAASPRTSRGSACSPTRPRRKGSEVEETDDQNGVAPFLAAAATRGRPTSRGCRRSSATRSSARRRSSRPRPARTRIVTATEETLHAAARPVRGAAPHERGTEGRVHAAGDGDLLPPAGRGVLPPGIFRLTFIEVGGQLAAGTIGFEFGGTRPCTTPRSIARGGPRARHGAGGRGHPARDRGRVRRLRPAEGRLPVQVPVRRRAAGREADRRWAARPA